jgi:tRNA (cmo5U34)-methyltransferase
VTVGALFGEAARDYDRARRQLVLGFDRFYGVVLESIPFQTEQEIRVLDLGAATGLLSAMVVEKFPGRG